MNERLLQLLTDEATEGLSPEARSELEGLLEQSPDFDPEADREQFQRAAASLHLAMLSAEPAAQVPMPQDAKARLLASMPSTLPASDAVRPAPTVTSAPAADRDAPRTRGFDWRSAGWVAAAAMAVLWVSGTLRDSTPVAPDPPSLAEQRSELIERDTGTLVIPWSPSDQAGFEGVRGDVAWNNARQEGFMRLAGLPVNDPSVEQYQLWVVDPSRDENPVDGGVFDVNEAGEVIVPIDAKLQIVSPAAFAITVEQPGGVVVSDGPLVLVAAVDG